MIKQSVVAIFDIGKTNKKLLLFDNELNICYEEESSFTEIEDDDGFPCDDIEGIETWISDKCKKLVDHDAYTLKGINFTTYGATLVYLDKTGNRLTPLYNYLKPLDEAIPLKIYNEFGGKEEFCRRTASPDLRMLNSGFQALWLKLNKPGIYSKVEVILHFPQYLSYFLTGRLSAEHTSIGCHTALWDFDTMDYHKWTTNLEVRLPAPVAIEKTFQAEAFNSPVPVGIGIHDSSASLVPYLMSSQKEFILISTGTWCISMNPFNNEPLSAEELNKDCLQYLSIYQKPVKSSRFFLGRIHDVNVERLSSLYQTNKNAYKEAGLNETLLKKLLTQNKELVFFAAGIPEKLVDTSVPIEQFASFTEAYHQLMIDLTKLTAASIRLVISSEDHTRNLFITGGFTKNAIFIRLLKMFFPDKDIIISEISNATSLGAAMVLWKSLNQDLNVNLSLTRY